MSSPTPEAKGSFREHPLPKLLFYLYRKQFTGVMVVVQPPLENRLYLRDGMPVSAQVADVTEPVGRILLELGAIDDVLYNQSLAQMAASGQRQSDILKGMGAVTDEQIAQATKQQLFRKVMRLFRLPEASFALFREDHEFGRDPEEAAAMRVHPRRLIHHGVRNAYDLDRIRGEVGSALDERLFRLDPRKLANLERYQFGDDDRPLLDLLNAQSWNVPALCGRAGRGEVDVWMMVYTLLVTDMLELSTGTMSTGTSAPPTTVRSDERRPVATPVPFAGGGRSRPGSYAAAATRPRSGSQPPDLFGAIPADTTPRPTAPPSRPTSAPARPGSDPPQRVSPIPPRTSSPPPRTTTAPRAGSPPPRTSSAPPGPGPNPPRPGSNPPRPGSNPPTRMGATTPPRTGSNPPRPGSNPPALSQDAGALKKQIEDKLKFLDQQNHFDLLGVTRESTKDQIKSTYIALAKLFHPDRLVQFNLDSMRADVEKIFGRVSEAQSVLLDDRRRREYVQMLDGAARGDAERARKMLEAERVFQQGELALRQRQYAQAEEHFKQSVELNPEEGEHHAMLAWAIYQNPSHVRERVIDHVKQSLSKAIKLSRNNPRPYYLLGEIFLAENDFDHAIGFFRKTLELRDDHVEAERGLRLATMRKEKGGDKKGGLFRRKK